MSNDPSETARFAHTWLVLLFGLFGVVCISVSTHFLSEVTPWGSVATDYSDVVHAAGGKVISFSLAVFCFRILDHIFMPTLRIFDVIFGRKKWENVDLQLRAAVTMGYYTLFSAVIVGFMWGGM